MPIGSHVTVNDLINFFSGNLSMIPGSYDRLDISLSDTNLYGTAMNIQSQFVPGIPIRRSLVTVNVVKSRGLVAFCDFQITVAGPNTNPVELWTVSNANNYLRLLVSTSNGGTIQTKLTQNNDVQTQSERCVLGLNRLYSAYLLLSDANNIVNATITDGQTIVCMVIMTINPWFNKNEFHKVNRALALSQSNFNLNDNSTMRRLHDSGTGKLNATIVVFKMGVVSPTGSDTFTSTSTGQYEYNNTSTIIISAVVASFLLICLVVLIIAVIVCRRVCYKKKKIVPHIEMNEDNMSEGGMVIADNNQLDVVSYEP
ncbi:RPEL1 [Acrasis kona]|uniref:RPEL1 n=1 Tax=Acrasis kona TaxID=1008807 RepID=A0AAW2YTG4_9EUKA